MSTGFEVEDKYELPFGFELPELVDLPGVASIVRRESDHLEAVYFDTPDLRLARNNITVRRRSGGVDPGWHVKLPAGSDRLEVHRPLGRGQTVPAELRRLVLGRTRGMALAPVVQLRTTRTTHEIHDENGQVMASVMDDAVHGAALGQPGNSLELSTWREVEVQLGSADRKLLRRIGSRLRECGAEPSKRASKLSTVLADRLQKFPAEPPALNKKMTSRQPAGDVVRGYLNQQLVRLLDCDARVRLDQDESIHDMRVATRRLRSTLSTFGRLLPAPLAADLERRLGELANTLGRVRDAQVLAERFDARLDDVPAELAAWPDTRSATSGDRRGPAARADGTVSRDLAPDLRSTHRRPARPTYDRTTGRRSWQTSGRGSAAKARFPPLPQTRATSVPRASDEGQ